MSIKIKRIKEITRREWMISLAGLFAFIMITGDYLAVNKVDNIEVILTITSATFFAIVATFIDYEKSILLAIPLKIWGAILWFLLGFFIAITFVVTKYPTRTDKITVILVAVGIVLLAAAPIFTIFKIKPIEKRGLGKLINGDKG